jgi:hypothetical protein
MPTTTDRGEIIHLAGFHRLSPALEAGSPLLLGHGEGARSRCGWEQFFAAMENRGLAVTWNPDDPASVRMVPREQARRDPPHRASLRRAIDDARRIFAALVRRA